MVSRYAEWSRWFILSFPLYVGAIAVPRKQLRRLAIARRNEGACCHFVYGEPNVSQISREAQAVGSNAYFLLFALLLWLFALLMYRLNDTDQQGRGVAIE
jgi:hypothetical protein